MSAQNLDSCSQEIAWLRSGGWRPWSSDMWQLCWTKTCNIHTVLSLFHVWQANNHQVVEKKKRNYRCSQEIAWMAKARGYEFEIWRIDMSSKFVRGLVIGLEVFLAGNLYDKNARLFRFCMCAEFVWYICYQWTINFIWRMEVVSLFTLFFSLIEKLK